MKDAEVVAERTAGEVSVASLHAMMVGRDLDAEYYREARQGSPGDGVVLEARGLGVEGAYHNVSFTLRRGEVLGVAGVLGSGREELTRTSVRLPAANVRRPVYQRAGGDPPNPRASCRGWGWLHSTRKAD